ncbi:nucleotidyltransferase family protein [Candidatus Poribacteria bacterium]
MTEAEKITDELRKNMLYLKERYSVSSLGLFGSHVHGEQQGGSDVDILVEFEDSPSLLKFIALERHLSDLIGKKVDLVMKSALKPKIGERILEEVVSI